MQLIIKLYTIAFLLCLPFISNSQETWSIEDCIAYAIEHNVDIRKTDISISEAHINTKLSEQNLLPYLDFNSKAAFGVGRSIDPTSNDFVNSNILSSDLGLSSEVILYKGGMLKNEIAQSKVQQEILQADKEVLMSHLILNMINEYFNVLLAEDNYSNIEIQLQSLNEQIGYFEKLVTEGSRAQYELIELQAQQANVERRLLFAEHEKARTMIDLKRLLNLEHQQDIKLIFPDFQIDDTNIGSLSEEILTKRAMNTIPELNFYGLLQKHGELNMKIAEGLKKPIVSLRGAINSNFSSNANKIVSTNSVLTESSVFINGNRATFGQVNEIPGRLVHTPYNEQLYNNLSFGLSLQMVVPIFDNYKSQGAQEQAKLELEIIKADKEQWLNDLTYQMSQYLNKAHETINNLRASEKLLSIRKIAMENAIKRFEHGAISSYDFIDVQEELNIAEVEFLIAKYEFMKIKQILDFYQGNIYKRENQ